MKRSISLWVLTLCGALLLAPATPVAAEEPVSFDVASLPMPAVQDKARFMASMEPLPLHDKKMLPLRYERFQALKNNKDLWRDKESQAFLLTSREEFVLPQNLKRTYDHAFLDIGYGVTISGPHLVMRMTSALDVQPEDRVLEVGTGSGYQSAILAHLSNHVYTVEIIEPLHQRTRELYTKLIDKGYGEYVNVHLKSGDGYYGWEEMGPFNKIIVTCAIDHIPPPLLKQLAPNGVMVIPVGPPGKQTLLEVRKEVNTDGKTTITRKDVYNGRKSVSFVPFTKKEGGGTWSGKGLQ
ncbi:MAG: protein-L-isoaspartate O-methyltransferase [Magnetococcales bacterium]|nr:protein-L-isoaspartate O-methyltransferase [Magnetococcales bacterium]